MTNEKTQTDYEKLIIGSSVTREIVGRRRHESSLDELLGISDMDRVENAEESLDMAVAYARTFGESYFHMAQLLDKSQPSTALITKAFGSKPAISPYGNHPDASVNSDRILTYTSRGNLSGRTFEDIDLELIDERRSPLQYNGGRAAYALTYRLSLKK